MIQIPKHLIAASEMTTEKNKTSVIQCYGSSDLFSSQGLVRFPPLAGVKCSLDTSKGGETEPFNQGKNVKIDMITSSCSCTLYLCIQCLYIHRT